MTKVEARRAARARRAAASRSAVGDTAAALGEVLSRFGGRPIAGYAPIRDEIDPMPAMAAAAARGPVALPVVVADGAPLVFRAWTPEAAMVPGAFGAPIPGDGDEVTPEVLIVPMLAFDRRGRRLGYGGGFYDRTLAGLRAAGPVTAIGFAFAGQEMSEVPTEPTDAPLDMIVTEAGIVQLTAAP